MNRIIRRLTDAGFEACAVGGCVRDSLLGRKPQDWDITTSAAPEEVKSVFPHTVDTGIRHGTVTVLEGIGEDREAFEVTTYRIDGEYDDARHPREVTFTPDLKEDLRRRDFTINAMAYSEETGLIDLFGGKEDLERKLIRAVGVSSRVLADTQTLPFSAGDRILLCSDGLYSMVPDTRIAELMRQEQPEQLPELLIAEANNCGGRDNISVILLTD